MQATPCSRPRKGLSMREGELSRRCKKRAPGPVGPGGWAAGGRTQEGGFSPRGLLAPNGPNGLRAPRRPSAAAPDSSRRRPWGSSNPPLFRRGCPGEAPGHRAPFGPGDGRGWPCAAGPRRHRWAVAAVAVAVWWPPTLPLGRERPARPPGSRRGVPSPTPGSVAFAILSELHAPRIPTPLSGEASFPLSGESRGSALPPSGAEAPWAGNPG
jgi:hypothetical protein